MAARHRKNPHQAGGVTFYLNAAHELGIADPMSNDRPSRQWPADMPGVTTAWLARANDVSERTIRWRRSRAATAPEAMPAIDAEIALEMTRDRPKKARLNWWTRLAIAERARTGETYRAIAADLGINKSTVWKCLRRQTVGFGPLSGERVMTAQQAQVMKVPRL